MGWIVKWLINGLAVFLAAMWIPGVQVKGYGTALLVALVLGIVNALIRPILVVLTLPLNIMTLGLFTFIINGFLFWLVGHVIQGFYVTSFLGAILGAIFVSLVSWVLNIIWKGIAR
ncbi:phage holin family protein [Polycladomyces sp. WAk]|uniref:Phage holin family protein n=1 Tax=Polycladomyces zharkentensis TaxID=2807616 RepID=A0ABS2WED8_9BACL|nr:phage holin family protein [Polycladomyces sp. WAk]